MENKLEDRPIISVGGGSPAPGVDSESFGRFVRWRQEVYIPMYLALPGRTGVDWYTIVNDSAEYPPILNIIHTDNIKFTLQSLKSPERIALHEDGDTWVKRRVMEYIWNERYALIRSFRRDAFGVATKEDTKIENAPLLHLESYHPHTKDQDKYLSWLKDYGLISYIPLFMRLPGIKGYDCYKKVSYLGLTEAREWDYPEFLSLLYFEDKTAFENYTKSPELLAFKKALSNVFPNGLNLRWYVQYQLIKSWRK